jgi:CRISP-associated protein Cas1
LQSSGKKQLYWNIPIANTTTILLGNGTSLTQAAMRELAKAGVMVGFSGGGGTPLFAGTDTEIAVSWLSPQSEYRPTEYLQHWVRFWFDDELRLEAAKEFQFARLAWIKKLWTNPRSPAGPTWEIKSSELDSLILNSLSNIAKAPDHSFLLTEEARLTKQLYKIACRVTQYGDFTRSDRGESTDSANRFLDHGNYLAYGLGATATWVLGIPPGLAVLHGKTRRGGLVFDVADLVKDAIILPQAFISAASGDSEQEFRQACIASLTKTEALDFQIDTLKDIAIKLGRKAMATKK